MQWTLWYVSSLYSLHFGVLRSPELKEGKTLVSDFITTFNSWPKSMVNWTWFSKKMSTTLGYNSITLEPKEKYKPESCNGLSLLSVKGPGCRLWSMFLVTIIKEERAEDLESLVKYSENSSIMILQLSQELERPIN